MSKQQERIVSMRESGMSNQDIAKALGVSGNYVRAVFSKAKSSQTNSNTEYSTCRFCDAPLEQVAGMKRKQFCSNKCRDAWYNRLKANRTYNRTCEYCGNSFTSIGNPSKRFCSRTCRTLAARKGDQNAE